MKGTLQRLVKASLLAGLLPGVIAPVLWPVVVLLLDGNAPDWANYPVAALAIALLAVIGGLLGCTLIGLPCLLLLEKLRLNTPLVAAIAGAILGALAFLILGQNQAGIFLTRFWPITAFFGLIAALCAYAASYFSRPGAATTPPAALR